MTPTSAAERAAEQVRSLVLEGRLRPGAQLAEQALADQLAVSRNTLREAFRLLVHEGLAEHHAHRGVFVRRPTPQDAREIYQLRRLVEVGALREAAAEAAGRQWDPTSGAWAPRVAAVRAAADAGLRAAQAGDWEAAGTANGDLHLALGGLAGSAALDATLRRLLSTMRLLFVTVGEDADPASVHAPYVADNTRLAALVEAGQLGRAAAELEAYLLRAEAHLVGA